MFWLAIGEFDVTQTTPQYNVDNVKTELEKAVMSQMKPGTCFKEDRQKVSDDYHRKHLALLAKAYLLVCQRIGVLPLHHEHWSQMSASRNSRAWLGTNIGGYKRPWNKCPLPPRLGMS